MRVLLYLVPILLCILVSTVKCQDGEDGDDNLLKRFRDLCKRWIDGMRDWWGDLRKEFKARASEMGDFGQEMWRTMKDKLNEWVNSQNNMDDSQRIKMREYIERMQMPDELNEE